MHGNEQNDGKAHFRRLSARAICLAVLISFCMASFGKGHAMKKAKHIGQVFTPTYLVQDILDSSGYTADADIVGKHVIDNSCGDGAFLDEVVRRYAARFLSRNADGRTLSRHLSEYVHGIEIDPIAHAACIRRLNGLAEEFDLRGVSWDIRNADALTVRDYDGRMDYVVGNPPYVRVHNLAENFGKVKSFNFCKGGMTDLYLVFYEIGLRMLSDVGVYGGLYVLTDIDDGLLRRVLFSKAFTEYVVALKKYKSGGYYTFSSQDLERYLNHALHGMLSNDKRRKRQAKTSF